MADSNNKNLSLKDIFNNLKTSVLGTETSKIDNFIDKTFNKIDLYSDKINRNTYIDAIKHLTTSKKGDFEPSDVIKDLQESPMDIRTIDTSDRINRYREYDAIISKISHCKRALNVLSTNIVSPDNITKYSIEILTVGNDVSEDDKNEKTIGELTTIKKDLNLDNYTTQWVYNTMLRGDYFVEILHSPKGEFAHVILTEEERVAILSDKISVDLEYEKYPKRNIILESSDVSHVIPEQDFKNHFGDELKIHLPKRVIIDGFEKQLKTGQQYVTEGTIKDVVMPPKTDPTEFKNDKKSVDPENFSGAYDEKGNKKDKNKKSEVDLKDIFITNHKPGFVVRLESERFRSCLGYLIFPKIDLTPNNMFTYLQNVLKQSPVFSVYSTSVQNPVDVICKKILEELQKKLQTQDSKVYNNKDLKDAVLNYLAFIKEDDDLKIRYVPPHMMVHMRIDVNKFEPYGESIFDSVIFDAKLLIALKAANAIKQISSCSDKRIISVESGLARNAKHIINKVKETMRKRKISVDTLGSIDSIPSQITTFEDIYLPMLDGKEFVRFNSQQWGQQPGNDVENMKFIRDNLVANLHVPPNHIGIEDNNQNRANLASESCLFARTIVGYQKQFSIFLKELFEKIYLLMHPKQIDDLNNIQIGFPIPKTSEYEHEMEYVEQMNRLFDVYKQLDIPIDFLKKKYLPGVNWDEIEKLSKEEKIKGLVEPDVNQAAAGGGMGGFGAPMPGGGGLPGGF